MDDFDSVRALASAYFDGLYDGDVPRLSTIFHARSRLHAMLEGKLMEIAFADYMQVIANRPSPRSQQAARADRLIAIHQTTTTTALLIVSVLISGKSFTDHLSLIKDGDRWQIISKVYHLNNPDN